MIMQTDSPALASIPAGGLAVVIGASGGIGQAFDGLLNRSERFTRVVGFSRPALDLTSEPSVAAAAAEVAEDSLPVRLVVVATGFLHGGGMSPEKSWRDLDPEQMAHAFAVNTIGPALVMKHFLPLLPRAGKSVFAALSARVGSIGDNRLGGWYSYRASKAALNQFVRTASVELRRRHPEAICVALHPGTVNTRLSAPFAKAGLEVGPPGLAAGQLLDCLDRLGPGDSGKFFDHRGERVAW
jgi:NAD(P)-dependent dehydrogenase (short-subunit alcohol dehydrogenase family)